MMRVGTYTSGTCKISIPFVLSGYLVYFPPSNSHAIFGMVCARALRSNKTPSECQTIVLESIGREGELTFIALPREVYTGAGISKYNY